MARASAGRMSVETQNQNPIRSSMVWRLFVFTLRYNAIVAFHDNLFTLWVWVIIEIQTRESVWFIVWHVRRERVVRFFDLG